MRFKELRSRLSASQVFLAWPWRYFQACHISRARNDDTFKWSLEDVVRSATGNLTTNPGFNPQTLFKPDLLTAGDLAKDYGLNAEDMTQARQKKMEEYGHPGEQDRSRPATEEEEEEEEQQQQQQLANYLAARREPRVHVSKCDVARCRSLRALILPCGHQLCRGHIRRTLDGTWDCVDVETDDPEAPVRLERVKMAVFAVQCAVCAAPVREAPAPAWEPVGAGPCPTDGCAGAFPSTDRCWHHCPGCMRWVRLGTREMPREKPARMVWPFAVGPWGPRAALGRRR
ncbi:hypothetical protein P8C59_005831 [Phyllachora maydis]|uniref:Uncharacterized protein n=1 Tax=Phyllachora maydis TaxID=1825666 RepID=A0AAD9MEW7_9PEZI|nr:hypothetical protein P8C59_005831 [Phyllachora maydis]